MTISWQAFQNEALDCLRALVRLDTTNPPGNERIAADYMADALGAHGVESVIRESAPDPGQPDCAPQGYGFVGGRPAALVSYRRGSGRAIGMDSRAVQRRDG